MCDAYASPSVFLSRTCVGLRPRALLHHLVNDADLLGFRRGKKMISVDRPLDRPAGRDVEVPPPVILAGGGGCSTSGAGSQAGFFLMLGLALVARRRR